MTNDPFAVDAMTKVWMQMQNQFAAAQRAFWQPAAVASTKPAGSDAREATRKLAEDWLAAVLPPGQEEPAEKGIVKATLRRMLDPSEFMAAGGDDVSRVIQTLVGGSSPSDLVQIETQVLNATEEWLTLQAARAEYQTVVAQAWARAFARFAEAEAKPQDTSADEQHQALDRWMAIANDEVIASQRSEPFLTAQRKLLRAAADYHLRARALIEAWCETRSIPTRSEVDELHATVHQLKRELRYLKRASASSDGSEALKATPQ